jgi:hypothetical protein
LRRPALNGGARKGRPNMAEKLAIEYVDDATGEVVRTMELDDPRTVHCEEYNRLKLGRTARPTAAPLHLPVTIIGAPGGPRTIYQEDPRVEWCRLFNELNQGFMRAEVGGEHG